MTCPAWNDYAELLGLRISLLQSTSGQGKGQSSGGHVTGAASMGEGREMGEGGGSSPDAPPAVFQG